MNVSQLDEDMLPKEYQCSVLWTQDEIALLKGSAAYESTIDMKNKIENRFKEVIVPIAKVKRQCPHEKLLTPSTGVFTLVSKDGNRFIH
jgi:hypothetical protein